MAVLDTNVIIEISKGNKYVLDKMLSADSYFPNVGAPKFVELNLIDSLNCLDFNEKSADVASEIYKKLKKIGKIMSLRDLFIGAICLSNNEKLITMDSDFKILQDFGLEILLIK